MIQRVLPPLISGALFFLLLFIYTKLAGPIPFSVNSVTTTKTDTFNVTAEGESFVKPDIATLNVGISASGSSVKQVQDQINTSINKVSEAIKGLGVKGEDIQTSNYSINPDYDYTEGRQRIKGYSANTTLTVKVRNLEDANKVIDTATENGANQVGGLNFDVENKTEAENEAREKAVQKAKKKAEQAAKVAGFKLGRLVNYTESFMGGPIPMPLNTVISDVEQKTQIEQGSTGIFVTVTLSYEIVD